MEHIIKWNVETVAERIQQLEDGINEMETYKTKVEALRFSESAGNSVTAIDELNAEIAKNITYRINIMNGLVSYLTIKNEEFGYCDSAFFRGGDNC